MNQLSLFDQPARARDAATSQLAATDICTEDSLVRNVVDAPLTVLVSN